MAAHELCSERFHQFPVSLDTSDSVLGTVGVSVFFNKGKINGNI